MQWCTFLIISKLIVFLGIFFYDKKYIVVVSLLFYCNILLNLRLFCICMYSVFVNLNIYFQRNTILYRCLIL